MPLDRVACSVGKDGRRRGGIRFAYASIEAIVEGIGGLESEVDVGRICQLDSHASTDAIQVDSV